MTLHSHSPPVSSSLRLEVQGVPIPINGLKNWTQETWMNHSEPHKHRARLCRSLSALCKQNHRHVCMHMHTQKHAHCHCIYTVTPQSSRGSLSDCTCINMCTELATLPVNRLPTAQAENMHSSPEAVVSNH